VTLGVQRGFPKLGDEAFPGHQNFNGQLTKFMGEGGKVYCMPVRTAGALRARRAVADPGDQADQSARCARPHPPAPQGQRLHPQHVDAVKIRTL